MLLPDAFNIPAQMVVDIADGMRDPQEVATGYGFTPSQWRRLEKHPPFVAEVAAKRSELYRLGVTTILMNRMYAEEIGKELFKRTLQPTVTVPQLQESYRLFAKLGDMEPKAALVQPNAGSGFSLVINFPALPDKPIKTVEAESKTLELPFAAPASLPKADG